MNTKTLVLVLLVVIVVGGLGVMMMQGQSRGPAMESTAPALESDDSVGDAMMQAEEPQSGTVKEFTVEGTPFAFSVTEMRVNQGDTVRVTFTNKQGMHDWVLDEFNAATKQLQAGQSETIEFVADKAGTYEYYCSVGNHRAQGMVGNLVVE